MSFTTSRGISRRTASSTPKEDVTYKQPSNPSAFMFKDLGKQPSFNAVKGISLKDLTRTIHIQNNSETPLVFEFHKFLTYTNKTKSVTENASDEKRLILEQEQKPIVSIRVGQGSSDCYVECARHGIYFYQDSSYSRTSEEINHRGNQENNVVQSRLFILEDNNSGEFQYYWDQNQLSYVFECTDRVLGNGVISIEKADNNQECPKDINLSFEVVSVVVKENDQGDPVYNTSQLIPRSLILTNVYETIPEPCLFIVRQPTDYTITTKDPNSRWGLNKKPNDNYVGFGYAMCGDVIFATIPEYKSPQKVVDLRVLDSKNCTPIFDGNQINSNNIDVKPSRKDTITKR